MGRAANGILGIAGFVGLVQPHEKITALVSTDHLFGKSEGAIALIEPSDGLHQPGKEMKKVEL